MDDDARLSIRKPATVEPLEGEGDREARIDRLAARISQATNLPLSKARVFADELLAQAWETLFQGGAVKGNPFTEPLDEADNGRR